MLFFFGGDGFHLKKNIGEFRRNEGHLAGPMTKDSRRMAKAKKMLVAWGCPQMVPPGSLGRISWISGW